jgi:hypothetical protein
MKSFDFDSNFQGRMLLQRVQRHISQQHVRYNLETGLFIPPPQSSPFWIAERLLVQMEREFEDAKHADSKLRRDKVRKARA